MSGEQEGYESSRFETNDRPTDADDGGERTEGERRSKRRAFFFFSGFLDILQVQELRAVIDGRQSVR